MYLKYALTGTHSSGKTSLINYLTEVEEFSNFTFFTERTKYLKDNFKVTLNDDSQIISQYMFLGERARELHYPQSTFTDRSIYDVMAYTLSAKSISDEDKGAFINACQPLIRYYDCIFYVDPEGVLIEDNGLRHTSSIYRDQINQYILDLLQAFPPNNLIVVKGTTQERSKIITDTLAKYL